MARRQHGSDMTAIEAGGTSPSADHARREVAREFVLRLASGHVTERQMAALRQWLAADRAHQAAFEAERAVWRALAPLRTPLARSMARREPEPCRAMPSMRARAGWSVAAAALAACLALFMPGGDLIMRLRADH